MSNPETIQDQTSNAGPLQQAAPDWEDLNWEAFDMLKAGRHITGKDAARRYQLLMERAIEKIRESITLRGGK